jgi:hypothetical protein
LSEYRRAKLVPTSSVGRKAIAILSQIFGSPAVSAR